MKKLKRRSLLILAVSIILTFTACTTDKSEKTDEPVESTTPETEVETTEVKITDVVGREVILDKPASKVVGTHNPSLNAVVVLGGGEKYLAGFGNKDMSRGLYSSVMEDFDGLVQIGKGSNINFETVAATGADLAILPERFKDQVDQFEKIGVTTIVALPNNESFDSVKTTIETVGKVLGENERASKINGFFDKKITDTQSITAEATDKPTVLFLGGSSPLSVAPSAMIQTQLIEAAGGTNAVSGVEAQGKFVDVNVEQIIAWNPDVIWFPAYVDYTVESLLEDPAWSSINAIKNKKVYKFPSELEPWDQPTAAVSLGVCWATHNLYPDLYSLDDLMGDADEFYKLVYDKTFTSEELGLE